MPSLPFNDRRVLRDERVLPLLKKGLDSSSLEENEGASHLLLSLTERQCMLDSCESLLPSVLALIERHLEAGEDENREDDLFCAHCGSPHVSVHDCGEVLVRFAEHRPSSLWRFLSASTENASRTRRVVEALVRRVEVAAKENPLDDQGFTTTAAGNRIFTLTHSAGGGGGRRGGGEDDDRDHWEFNINLAALPGFVTSSEDDGPWATRTRFEKSG